MGLSRGDLLNRVKWMSAVFETLLGDQAYPNLSESCKKELETGVNKAYGQASGFLVEYLTTTKHLNQKRREVTTQVYGDVTVGAPDQLFAKTVECKSVTAPTKSAVDEQIVKALKQLGGDTGHDPRDGDVRVLRLFINRGDNHWPFTDQGRAVGDRDSILNMNNITQDEVVRTAIDVIMRQFGKGEAARLKAWLLGETEDTTNLFRLKDIPSANPGIAPAPFPNSTRPVLVTPSAMGSPTSPFHKIRCVTIKVEFEPVGWLTLNQQSGEVTELVGIKIQVYKSGLDLRYEAVDVKNRIVPIP